MTKKSTTAWRKIQPIIRDRLEARKSGKRIHHDGKRESEPIVLRDVEFVRFDRIPASELQFINIDRAYQRETIEPLVSDLAFVLRHGGLIPNPVTIVMRKDQSLWIVDGQQRFWGHLDAATTMRDPPDMPVVIYRVTDYATERDMFTALNTVVRVSPLAMVKAWAGPCRTMLDAAFDDAHGCHGRFTFGKAIYRGINGVSAIRAMFAAATGRPARGSIIKILQALDRAIVEGAARARAETIFDLLGEMFPDGLTGLVRPTAVGLVAFERWGRLPDRPRQAIITAIAKIDWKLPENMPGNAMKFLDQVKGAIAKRWS